MPIEGSMVGKVRGKYGELAVQWREQCQAHLAQGAAGSHSAGDGGAVTGVGGRDFDHNRCAPWRPDAA